MQIFRFVRPKIVLISVAMIVVAACQGGGGGGSTVVAVAPYNYSLGTASTQSNAETALANLGGGIPYDHYNGPTYASFQAAAIALNGSLTTRPIDDTNARAAWADGWTGRGVGLGIIDTFNSNGRFDTHGDYVSLVAESIAPEAIFSLYGYTDPAPLDLKLSQIFSAYDAFEANGSHIVNNSWGVERSIRSIDGSYTGALIPLATWNAFITSTVNGILASTAAPYDPRMLFVYAAGNGGAQCTGGVGDCNYFGAITVQLRQRGYEASTRVLFVGSLNDAGTALASYSLRAGSLPNDFIVAHDDVLTTGDNEGTSFVAPRVSAAAALVRQKFPNLDGSALKQVLVQTADDLGVIGPDPLRFGSSKYSKRA